VSGASATAQQEQPLNPGELEEPLETALFEPLGALLQRYRRVAGTLGRLIETLEGVQPAGQNEFADTRPAVARIETQSGDIDSLLYFQEQLAGLDGVMRVTIAGSTGERASFIVELEGEADRQPEVDCTVCGRVIRAGSVPASHGLCETCRSEFGAPPGFRSP
jgi:hypothetical protein